MLEAQLLAFLGAHVADTELLSLLEFGGGSFQACSIIDRDTVDRLDYIVYLERGKLQCRAFAHALDV